MKDCYFTNPQFVKYQSFFAFLSAFLCSVLPSFATGIFYISVV